METALARRGGVETCGVRIENAVRVKELAAWLDAAWEGDGECDVRRVASLEDAGPADLSFVTGGRAARHANTSHAGCLLVPADFSNETQRTVIRTPDPRTAVARTIL